MSLQFQPIRLFGFLLALTLLTACSDANDSSSTQLPENDSDLGQTASNGVPVSDEQPVEATQSDQTSADTLPSGSGDQSAELPEAPESDEADDSTTDNSSDAPADDQPVDYLQTDENLPDNTLPDNTADSTSVTQPGGASGVDLSGGDDDSPTPTESLSLSGPSIKDSTRGAGPPSKPVGLTRLMAAENWVEFSWVPSTDDQAVKAYEIYRDGQLIATVSGDTGHEYDYRSWLSTSFIDCNFTRYANCVDGGLQPQTGASYAYSVVAVDNEGLRSEPSDEIVLSMATPQHSTVDVSTLRPVFSEEFNGNKLDRSRWKTSLPWGPDVVINREMQHFVNTFGSGNPVDYDPFVFTGDTLQITGISTPVDQLQNANGQPYLSGVLTTSDYFEMTYGYVEMRAKLASGQGILSTFYLFNQNYEKNKPEIDIVEYMGNRVDKSYQTYHYYDSNRTRFYKGEKHSSPTMETIYNQDLSSDFHTYGVLWEPQRVVWYIDGVEVRRLEGPRVSDEPMNIVTQLVMGSEWILTPDPAAVPAVLEIDYIRAWQ